MAKLKQISVRGVAKNGKWDNKVALWERHPDHPEGGEAFVVNDGKSKTVAETPEVKRAIAEGRLKTGKDDSDDTDNPTQPNTLNVGVVNNTRTVTNTDKK